MPTLPVHIGQHLRAARETAGLSQRQAADRIGVAQSAINGWEHGSSALPIRRAFAVAHAYSTTLDQLLGYQPPEGA